MSVIECMLHVEDRGHVETVVLEMFMRGLYGLQPGDYWLSAQKIYRKHTRKQQNGHRLLCRILGRELGETEDEIHRIAMVRCGFYHEREIAGELEKLRWSETQLDVEQHIRLIDQLYQIAAFTGVQLPVLDAGRRIRT